MNKCVEGFVVARLRCEFLKLLWRELRRPSRTSFARLDLEAEHSVRRAGTAAAAAAARFLSTGRPRDDSRHNVRLVSKVHFRAFVYFLLDMVLHSAFLHGTARFLRFPSPLSLSLSLSLVLYCLWHLRGHSVDFTQLFDLLAFPRLLRSNVCVCVGKRMRK